MFHRAGAEGVVRVGLKILYRNPRRPGEAGMKLVPDPSQRAAEKEILKGLGFTVIEITPATFAHAPHPALEKRLQPRGDNSSGFVKCGSNPTLEARPCASNDARAERSGQ